MATKQEQQPQEQQPQMQQNKKKAKKREKTLPDVLPTRGFEYRIGQKAFEDPDDTYAFKAAMHQATNNLNKTEVDQLLADLMKKAKEVKKPGDSDRTIAFEEAGRQTAWTSELKEGVVSEALLYLINSRQRHIRFTHYRPNKIAPETEGKLAKAIDEFTGESPAAEPDEEYREMDEMDPRFIDNMMDRMRKGGGANWDAVSSYNPSDEEMEGAQEGGAKKGAQEAAEAAKMAEELGEKLGSLKLD
ncbi:hypothetical protein SLS62_011285 [Diatrype stigma]|uniref:Uncharacterized protein n=1 Tax=Diatrype stigma TaxID=117547 RepID=A0AAN9YFW9_9PEZI